MQRTSSQTRPPDISNVAKCHNALDAEPAPLIARVKTGDDGFGGLSGGIRTCVKDLLQLFSVFLASTNDQLANVKHQPKVRRQSRSPTRCQPRLPWLSPLAEKPRTAFAGLEYNSPERCAASVAIPPRCQRACRWREKASPLNW